MLRRERSREHIGLSLHIGGQEGEERVKLLEVTRLYHAVRLVQDKEADVRQSGEMLVGRLWSRVRTFIFRCRSKHMQRKE